MLLQCDPINDQTTDFFVAKFQWIVDNNTTNESAKSIKNRKKRERNLQIRVRVRVRVRENVEFICFSFHINGCCELSFVEISWFAWCISWQCSRIHWPVMIGSLLFMSSSKKVSIVRKVHCFIVVISHKQNCNSTITFFSFLKSYSNNSSSYRYKCWSNESLCLSVLWFVDICEIANTHKLKLLYKRK